MKFAVHTLGCKVNQNETGALAQLFEASGYTVVDTEEAADVYVVKTESGSVSFPALKEVVREIDTEKGVITLDGRMFARTAVYNA